MKKTILILFVLLFASCGKNEPKPIEISMMASRHLVGAGVEKNINKAIILYRNACKKGHALSCAMIGKIYEEDMLKTHNKRKNFKLAEKWYQLTCDKGEKSGCNAVERIRALSSGDPCHTTLSSFNRHLGYLIQHDGGITSKSACEHVEKAVLDGRKIQKVCSNRVLAIREYREGVRRFLRTRLYKSCTEIRFR